MASSLLDHDLLDEAPSFPDLEFMNMMNNSEVSLNLNITIQDVLNPRNDETEKKPILMITHDSTRLLGAKTLTS